MIDHAPVVQPCGRCEAPATLRFALSSRTERPDAAFERRGQYRCPFHSAEVLDWLAAVAPGRRLVLDNIEGVREPAGFPARRRSDAR